MGKEVRAIIEGKEIVFRKTKKTISDGKEIETNQATLFAEIWQENETIPMPKEKRVHFKNPTYRKSYQNDVINITNTDGISITQCTKDDIITWGRLREILKDLTQEANKIYKTEKYRANPYNYELNDDIFNINGNILQTTIDIQNNLRVWKDFSEIDTNEQGANVWETEIIGSEDLHITERLYLHESLLNALRNGVELSEAMTDIKLVLNLLKKGYTLDQSKYVLETIRGKQNANNQKVNM